MDDLVETAGERLLHDAGIGDVAEHHIHGRIGMRLQVYDTDITARGGQLRNYMAADESRTAGDEDADGSDVTDGPRAHFLPARAAETSSECVSAQRTVGRIALVSTRSRYRSTTSNMWSISASESSVGFRPRPSSAVWTTL